MNLNYIKISQSPSNRNYETLKKRLFEEVCIENSTILDLGVTSFLMDSKLCKTHQIHCIDNDSNCLSIVPQECQQIDLDLNQKSPLPFNDRSFDIIVLFDILEHIAWPEYYLQQCLRILKPEGKILISVPNSVNLFNRYHFLIGDLRDNTDNSDESLFSDHLHAFSLRKIKMLAKKYQLRVESIKYHIPLKPQQDKNLLRSFIRLISLQMIQLLKLHKIIPSLFAINFVVYLKKEP